MRKGASVPDPSKPENAAAERSTISLLALNKIEHLMQEHAIVGELNL